MHNNVWPLVHAERAALIDDLTQLEDEQWDVPSLCAGWTVHDVAAHLVDSARTTRWGFLLAMVRARFDFDRLNAAGVARERGPSPRDTLERLRHVQSRTSTPPAPLDSRLVEEIVHGDDIRRPLALTRTYPLEAVIRALNWVVKTPKTFGGAKEVLRTVRIEATDTDLTLGNGPAVQGPALALLLALAGRRTALDELEGPGTATLAQVV